MFIDEIHTGDRRRRDSPGGAMDASNSAQAGARVRYDPLHRLGRPTRNTASISRRIAPWFGDSKDRRQRTNRCRCDRNFEGPKPYFEEYHKLKYTSEAIKAAVELSSRYIHDRKLPGQGD